MHYKRQRRLGALELPTAEDRFWKLVDKTDNHWWWRGGRDRAGYGYFQSDNQSAGAHRWALYFTSGAMPPAGMDVDHLCHEGSCVNPDHLRIATRAENAQNRRGPDSRNVLGVRGVEVIERRSGTFYRARGKFNGKVSYLGTFDTLEEAAKASREARQAAWSVPGRLPAGN